MRDPYTILGLSRQATPDEIKASFRKLAKRYHPDSNPNDSDTLRQFQDVQQAYALLRDPDQRFRYDTGLIDADGAPRAQPFPPRRRRPSRTQSASFSFEPADDKKGEDAEDAMFSELFASLRRAKKADPDRPGPAASKPRPAPENPGKPPQTTPLSVSVSFDDAIAGTKVPVFLASGRKLMMSIPACVENDQIIRLKNVGRDRDEENVLVRVSVGPHPVFSRSGLDISCELAIPLADAVLGNKVRVPTLQGEVMVQIPDGANTGTVLKLRGRGIQVPHGPAGDQLVTLKLVLPDPPDAELTALLRDWARRPPLKARG